MSVTIDTIQVELGKRSYPIIIGEQLFSYPDYFLPYVLGNQIMIVSNETVAKLYLNPLLGAFTALQCDYVLLPDGEQYKTLSYWDTIIANLTTKKHHRSTTLVALGGGVIGDIAGFAAACYQRGVSFLQCPTTLLAQVDSAVGGKTGVNYGEGKNLVGAFYQPRCVISNLSTLDTLPEREYLSGLAEIIKSALITDAQFFNWLESHANSLRLRDKISLRYAIKRACQIKAGIIGQDEYENNKRMLLNLGHTFAHAIEEGLGYGTLLHGEAVAIGLVMAADLSVRMNLLNQQNSKRIFNLLKIVGLPVSLPSKLTEAKWFELMAMDKKVRDGKMRFVLLKQIGLADIIIDVPKQLLLETLQLNG